jgi:hypothetical protein
MKVLYPGDELPEPYGTMKIFLGGSIEMGKAYPWQGDVMNAFVDHPNTDLIEFLNPRRSNWDANWPQDPTEGTEFHKQVKWELNAQDIADIIYYNFLPGTQSPVTLLELGLYADAWMKTVVVTCPKEFWRYGNVKMVSDKYKVFFFETQEEAIDFMKEIIEENYAE